eukprot:5362268-Alexandrium_andersonii.AAC.1
MDGREGSPEDPGRKSPELGSEGGAGGYVHALRSADHTASGDKECARRIDSKHVVLRKVSLDKAA